MSHLWGLKSEKSYKLESNALYLKSHTKTMSLEGKYKRNSIYMYIYIFVCMDHAPHVPLRERGKEAGRRWRGELASSGLSLIHI